MATTGTGPVVGTGTHTYEWIDGWAKLPAGQRFGYTHAVAEDRQGRIFVHHMGKDAVAIFDPDGAFLSGWGDWLAEGAHGMELVEEGGREFLYLAPTHLHKVYKTTLDGDVVLELGWPEHHPAYQQEADYVPTNIAVAPNGDFYVADGYGKSYIHQYNAEGNYIRSIGEPGSGIGQLNCPHGIWIDMRGFEPRLLVADRSNVRLHYFTLDGEPQETISDDLLHPCHFDERDGDLLVPDLLGRVTIFDRDNKLLCHLGEQPGVHEKDGWPNLPHDQRIPGMFNSPHGACWDRAGNLYVAEWIDDGRVTKLRRTG